MKRKVKFQEGGEVGAGMTAAERRNAERRLERERARTARVRAPVQGDVADLSRRMQTGQLDAETMRRMGGTPFGSADALRSGAGMTPSAGGSAMSRMAPRAGGILGLLGLAPLAVDMYRSVRDRPRSQEDLDVMEAYRTGRDVREVRAAREAAARPAQPAVTPDQMQMADVPGNRATSGAGAPAAARMREVDMQGGDVPGNVAMNPQARSQPTRRAAAPARRESVTADDLNAMVLRLQSGAAPQTETERRLADRMGIAYRKGGMVKPKVGADFRKAKPYQAGGPVKVPGKYTRMGGAKAPAPRMRDMISPEERKELDAPLTQTEKNRLRGDNFKKGGKVAPKKMMKGGITSKPKAKPAKYAKGGMAKGRK